MKHLHTFESFVNESQDLITFSVNDEKLDQILQNFHKRELDYVDIKGDEYYTLPQKAFDRFIDTADSHGFDVDYENSEDSVIYVMESSSKMNEGVTSIPKDSPNWVHKIFKDKDFVEITPTTKLAKGDELVGIYSGTFYEVFKDNGAKVIIKDDAYGSQKTYTREEFENSFLIKQR